MSWDLGLVDENGKWMEIEEKHHMRGGTYCVGGSDTAEINITWNYSSFFYAVLGDKGIGALYDLTGEESIPILREAISKMEGVPSGDYWESTEGNAKHALECCLELAKMCPEGVWQGD